MGAVQTESRRNIQFQAARFGPSVARPAPGRSSPQGPSLVGRPGITAGLKPQPRSPPTPTFRIYFWGRRHFQGSALDGGGFPKLFLGRAGPKGKLSLAVVPAVFAGWGPAAFLAMVTLPQLARLAAAAAPLALRAVLVVDRIPRHPLASGSPPPRLSVLCFVALVFARASPFTGRHPHSNWTSGGGGRACCILCLRLGNRGAWQPVLSKRDTAVSPPSLRT